MKVQGLYAAMNVKDVASASEFYSRVLGRAPDDKPMDTLVQWRGFGSAGIQLFQDPSRAGQGIMTIVVPDLTATQSSLGARGIHVGPIREGDFGRIAQLVDPDGNVVTLAEPPRGVAEGQA